MLTTVFASRTVVRRFVGSGRVWAAARAPVGQASGALLLQVQRGRLFYSTAANSDKSKQSDTSVGGAKPEPTAQELAAIKFSKLTPSQKLVSYVFKSKVVAALLKYGPAFGGECALLPACDFPRRHVLVLSFSLVGLALHPHWPAPRSLFLPFFFFFIFLLTCVAVLYVSVNFLTIMTMWGIVRRVASVARVSPLT